MNIPKYKESFRKFLELKNYSKNTIENYVSQVSIFLNEMKGKFSEPAKVNEQVIIDYLRLKPQRKPTCFNRGMNLVNNFI